MSTSSLGPALQVAGLTIGVSSTDSPVSFTTIVNVAEMSLPTSAEKVDVTNVGDSWRRRIPALLDMGAITFKVYWIPTDTTLDNTSNGLRYLLINKTHRYFQFSYPDGLSSKDVVPAYVTGFSITGKVGGVFEAMLELSNSGAPTLV